MKIKKIIGALKYKILPSNKRIVNVSLLGNQLKTINGTIRKNVDQDDHWFYLLAKNSEIIFDIGANIGYSALLANVNGKVLNYIMVDPNPEALADASKNLLLNGLGKNCNFYPAFVGDKLGDKVKFYTVGSGAAGSMYRSHAKTAAILDNYYYVDSITIDYLIDFYHVLPDFIKIDVEGAESLVLNGAVNLAKMQKTKVMVEMHSPPELPMVKNAQLVIDWCKEFNYNPWYLKTGMILNKAEEIAHRGKCHLLLLPTSSEYPSYLKGVEQNSPLPQS